MRALQAEAAEADVVAPERAIGVALDVEERLRLRRGVEARPERVRVPSRRRIGEDRARKDRHRRESDDAGLRGDRSQAEGRDAGLHDDRRLAGERHALTHVDVLEVRHVHVDVVREHHACVRRADGLHEQPPPLERAAVDPHGPRQDDVHVCRR